MADDTVATITGNSFANGAGGVCQDGWLGDLEILAQAVPGFRAPYQNVFARFNLKHTTTLNVIRVHDTESNAATFLFTHADMVPVQGLLQVNALCTNGVAKFWQNNAKVSKVVRPKQTGVRMSWGYQFVFSGPWLTTNPT